MIEERHLIVGLGNPGEQYKYNRHNIGFMLIDVLAERWGIKMKRHRKNSLIGEGIFDNVPIVLAKPQTYMNNSGLAVAPLSRLYAVPPQKILVVCDDLDLAFGRIRLRPSGNAGGHHGLESIITQLTTHEFPRLRIGIGRPNNNREDVIDFVLTSFHNSEKKKLSKVLDVAAEAVETYLKLGIEMAMTQFNGVYLDEV